MSEMPLISVLMPAYNAAPFIAQAIASILMQSHERFELIIADDGSTDATRRVIQRFDDPRIRTVFNPENLGYFATYNHLLTLANGDYITFLDADDFCSPDRLALQLSAFRANSRLGMVGTAYELVSKTGQVILRIVEPLKHEELVEVVRTRNPFCGASLMFSRAAYERIGGYRTFFGGEYAYMDYDLACRVMEHFECANLPCSLYSYRQNPGSLSKRVSARRYLSDQLVRHLAAQRRIDGLDDLDRGNEAAVTAFMDDLLRPFRDDPALIYRKYARDFMSMRLHRRALATAWTAILIRPGELVNHKLLISFLRTMLRSYLGRLRRKIAFPFA